MRTPRGRVATPAAWSHLRLVPPVGSTLPLPLPFGEAVDADPEPTDPA